MWETEWAGSIPSSRMVSMSTSIKAVDIGRVARREIDPERVADETHELGVFWKCWDTCAENRARFRLFHIAFDADYAFPVHFGKQGMQKQKASVSR